MEAAWFQTRRRSFKHWQRANGAEVGCFVVSEGYLLGYIIVQDYIYVVHINQLADPPTVFEIGKVLTRFMLLVVPLCPSSIGLWGK